MASRAREDVLFQVRTLENELKVYEKQADVLFATLNAFISNQRLPIDACLVDAELEWTAVVAKAEKILNEQMLSTIRSISNCMQKIEVKHPSATVFNFDAIRDTFDDQHKLNQAILLDLFKNSQKINCIVHLSSLLHQPLIDYLYLEGLMQTIKTSI